VSRSHFTGLALLYALLIVYASTLVGPAGPHFVALDPGAAWQRFLATPYVENGSDQRADWMGNLSMLVPFGFLLTGSLWRPAGSRAIAVVTSGALCLSLVLAVKYAQLFFPPRTVTINYILAQGIGSALGIGLFAMTHGRLAAILRGRAGGGLEPLVFVLWAYTAALVVFLLMPLDFALNLTDLDAQFDRLPAVLTAVTGEGRPAVTRVVLILAGTAALLPVGMLLTVTRQRRAVIGRSVSAATGRGFLLMLAVFALSTLVISGSPSLLSLLYRTLGVAAGAWLMRMLSRADLERVRHGLARAAPLLAIPYLGLLLAVNGLLSLHWVGLTAAANLAYPLGVLPLFDYYIVTKAEAAKNIVGHVVMYAPIGVLLWARGRSSAAGVTAGLLSLGIEAARYFRPGLEGDVNVVAVAALSAWGAAWSMPRAWSILAGVAAPRATPVPGVIGWRERARAAQRRAALGVEAAGDIEEF
jgi:VanZ family protein